MNSVIHLAAALSVGESQKKSKKYNKINVIGTRNLLSAIKIQVLKILFFLQHAQFIKTG